MDPKVQHVAIMDSAGSGKTLAYLLPLMQRLRQEELAAKEHEGGAAVGERSSSPSLAQPKAPRMVVLAPTVELAQQVFRVVKALSASGLRCRSACMTGGQEEKDRRGKSWRTQVTQLEGGLDLVVATPGRVMEHIKVRTGRGSTCIDVACWHVPPHSASLDLALMSSRPAIWICPRARRLFWTRSTFC